MKTLNNKKKIIISITIITISTIGAVIFGGQYSKRKTVDEFSNYLNNLEKSAQNYILGDYEEEFNTLIVESQRAIDNKDKVQIGELQQELKDLQDKIIEEDQSELGKSLEELKKIDISKLDEDKTNEVSTEISKIEQLVEENKFNDANKIVIEIKESIADQLQEIVETEKQDEINTNLNKVENLINNNSLDDAKKLADLLIKETLNGDQKSKLEGYINTINDKLSKSKKLTVEEAMKLVMKEDKAGLDWANKNGAKLTYIPNCYPPTKDFGITEETYNAFIYQPGDSPAPYLVGKDTGNVYRGPTNGPLYLDIIKDGKAIKRYIGKDYN